ncbi:F-actin-capping protein subunit alpha, variant 2 [Dionaea muscipula]
MDEKLIQRLEKAVSRLEALSTGGVPREDDISNAASDPAIVAFDDLISNSLGRVSDSARKIGGEVSEATKILEDAFVALRELLIKVKQTQKPDMEGLDEFLKPLNEVMVKANALTEGRRSDFFNHQKTIADSLSALAWIAYTGKGCGMSLPIAHVEESWQMAEFYNNKVLVQFRNKDPNHVEWAKALKELYIPGLRDYVKGFYPLGPIWRIGAKADVSVPQKAPASSGPAPPPPPKAPLFCTDSPKASSSSSRPQEGMAAVFQEINSSNITAGLRKVTSDMKSKNRKDRAGVVSSAEKEQHTSPPAFSKSGPSKLELQMGRKWVVENQIGNKNLVIDACDAKQSVYIFGCKDSILQIQGKVNNITIDKCTKTGVVFKGVVAACEVVNCNSVEVQSQGSAPTISVDNTTGCQLYLSKESLEASITTSKSSEINVLVPASEAEGDWVCWLLPLSRRSYLNGFFRTIIPLSLPFGAKFL